MTVPPADDDSTVHSAQDRIADALGQLAPDQWEVTAVPGMITAIREWSDGSVDTVFVLSPESAYGRRDDAAKRLVWQTKGSVDAVVRVIEDLAPPRSPGAPSEPIPERTEPPL